MIKYFSALFSALLLLSVLAPIECGKFGGRSGGFGRGGGSHSYPSSHGLSGSGSRGGHGYPSSGGSHSHPSSSGGSHGYPSSGGLSGSGGSHGYPSSGGLSGSGGSHGYPSSSGGSHSYPSSSNTGGHSYPSSRGGLSGSGSGSGSHSYPSSKPNNGGHTTINNHYHYSPPQQISYAAPGHRPVSYPVYQGTPPTYVYQYKDSGSKYGTLLAGLALLNLGTLAGAAYAGSRSHANNYKSQPGEICKFAVRKSNGDYEETKIDCQLITSFILQDQPKALSGGGGANSTVVTTSVTNVTMVNMTNGAATATTTAAPTTLYQMLPNGTLVPVNVTAPNNNNNNNTVVPSLTSNGTVSSSVTVTTTNTTVVNALDVKGKEVEVTPGMECFVIRHTPTQNMKKHVSCGLLQSYATQSLKRNAGVRNVPTLSIMFAIAALVLY